MPRQLRLFNERTVHFVRAVGQAQGALVGTGLGEWKVV